MASFKSQDMMYEDIDQYELNFTNEDEYEEVYNGGEIFPVGNHKHLQQYKGWTYYQTYGGGPEGGWVVNPKTQEAYAVERTWYEPFKVSRELYMVLDIIKNSCMGGMQVYQIKTKQSDADFAKACKWQIEMRELYREGKLPKHQVDTLNKTPGWTWSGSLMEC